MRTPPTIAIVFGVVVGAFALGRASRKPQVVTVDKIQYVEREKIVTRDAAQVTKTVEVAGPVQWKTRTEYKEGKIVTVYQEVDKGADSKASLTSKDDKSMSVNQETRATQSHSVTVTARPEGWHLAASAGTRWGAWKPVYGAQVQRKILGPITVGVSASTDGGAVLLGITW